MNELRTVHLSHEGAALEGLIVTPNGPGPHPAVLVMSNALGLGEQARAVATQLAQQGYVALATDMYGGGIGYDDPKDARESIAVLWRDPALLRARVVVWFELLKARADVDDARVAAIGYCFGGQCVLELARSGADARAVVSFHGILKSTIPASQAGMNAYVAVYTGAIDPYVPRADVDLLRAELDAAGARWHITLFGDVLHSFTDRTASPNVSLGNDYDPLADTISWAGTLALLEFMLKSE